MNNMTLEGTKQCEPNIVSVSFSMKIYTSKTLNQLYHFSQVKKLLTTAFLMMVTTIHQTINIVI